MKIKLTFNENLNLCKPEQKKNLPLKYHYLEISKFNHSSKIYNKNLTHFVFFFQSYFLSVLYIITLGFRRRWKVLSFMQPKCIQKRFYIKYSYWYISYAVKKKIIYMLHINFVLLSMYMCYTRLSAGQSLFLIDNKMNLQTFYKMFQSKFYWE